MLSEAIVLWTGWGEATWPARDEHRLIARFGKPEADELMHGVRAAVDELYASDARLVARSLGEMGDRAIADFRQRRSDLSDEAVEALAWCYTFDYK